MLPKKRQRTGIRRDSILTVEYETGADAVMNLFIEHPALSARPMEINKMSETR